MAMILDWLSRKTGLNRQEAQGSLVLLCAVSLAVFVPVGLSAYYRSQARAEYAQLLARVDSALKTNSGAVVNTIPTIEDVPDAPDSIAASAGALVVKPHPFDPNTAQEADMTAAGIPAFLARRIQHYVVAGGKFRQVKDIRKIHGFDDGLYRKVQPWIRIRAGQEEVRTPGQKIQPVDVNEADSAALEALPGIGEFTASSILKYRRLLGGYVSLNQLYELYHQDSARTRQFSRYLFIRPGYEPDKIRINTADQVRLYHPYLNKTSSKLISAYVRQNGYLKGWEDLRAHKLVSDEELEKLRPYLSFD